MKLQLLIKTKRGTIRWAVAQENEEPRDVNRMVCSVNILFMYHSGIGQMIIMEDGTLPQTSKHVSKNYCFTLYSLPLLTSTFIIYMN